MGQRLNLEIVVGENVIANAYYHWSGFTSTSLEVTKKALEKFKSFSGYVASPGAYELALDMLENTGATFTKDELNAYNSCGFYDFFGNEIPRKERKTGVVDRNNGLISITSKGINSTRYWEEARVQIDVRKKFVNFDAVWEISEKELLEEYDINKKDLTEIEYDLSKIPFDKFNDFCKEIIKLIDNEVYYCIANKKIYAFIE